MFWYYICITAGKLFAVCKKLKVMELRCFFLILVPAAGCAGEGTRTRWCSRSPSSTTTEANTGRHLQLGPTIPLNPPPRAKGLETRSGRRSQRRRCSIGGQSPGGNYCAGVPRAARWRSLTPHQHLYPTALLTPTWAALYYRRPVCFSINDETFMNNKLITSIKNRYVSYALLQSGHQLRDPPNENPCPPSPRPHPWCPTIIASWLPHAQTK